MAYIPPERAPRSVRCSLSFCDRMGITRDSRFCCFCDVGDTEVKGDSAFFLCKDV